VMALLRQRLREEEKAGRNGRGPAA
jgi:hypothetical protein